MIHMISQLVSQQETGSQAPLAVNRKLPESVVAANTSRKEALPEVQGGMDDPSVAELTGALNQLNDYLQETHHSLRFSIDDDSGRTIVRVVNTKTDEVIRQLPSEEMLAVIRHFNEVTGNLFAAVA